MEAQTTRKLYTFDEYLALEQADGTRYEYYDGEVVAMAGTTKRHNLIVQSLSRALYPIARRKGCLVFAESVRQKLRTGQRYVYPDVIYTCDPGDLADDSDIFVRMPCLLIEVLSDSIEQGDHKDKRFEYYKIPSLKCYMLVSQEAYRVEVYERNVDFWKYRVFEGLGTSFYLDELDITLSLADIYDGLPELDNLDVE